MRGIVLFAASWLVAGTARAEVDATRAGNYFQHGDWEVACDNTGTCRAAGYQADEDQRAVSVLLTRKAGPNQHVDGQLMLGEYGDDDMAAMAKLPDPIVLQMRINGQPRGSVSVRHATLIGSLSSAQVAGLIASLSQDSQIEFVAGGDSWHLSGQGAAAVLLKMDDVQGRIGTRGALVRKGPRGEQHVMRARPVPVVHAAKVLDKAEQAWTLPHDQVAALQKLLAATTTQDDCESLFSARPDDLSLQMARLAPHKRLISILCWRAAYNGGNGFWVINDKPPFDPVLVTVQGTDYSNGSLGFSQKGRGLGDCWSTAGWTWDGRGFVQTAASSTGMCKLLAAGGAWELPTLVTDIK